ncbi:MAG: Macrolide-specific efflux protein MacA precursor [Verrucomicrobiota bacterium]|jgi:HlyD family secretion protein
MQSIRLRWLWLLLLLPIGLLVYRLHFAPAPAEAVIVNPAPFAAETFGTGTLEARRSAMLSARVPGRLVSVLVDQGETVTTGQLLAELDPAEARLRLATATAAQTLAAATLARIRTDEARASASLELARRTHTRVVALTDQQNLAAADLDKATEQLRLAETDLARTRAAITEAEASLASSTSQATLQEELLAQTRLTAPFAGLIVRRDRHPGEVVAPGASILHLVPPEDLWVSAWIDESAAASLAPGQPARLTFRSTPDQSYPATVTRIGRETDRETREFLIDLTPARLPANWTLGQRVDALIQTSLQPATLALPLTFIQYRQGIPGTWILRNNRARWTPLVLGRRNSANIAITTGLSPGDTALRPLQPDTSLDGRRVTLP